MSNESNYLYEFGDYVLNARERNLWLNAELVKMPAKAFDTLCMLVERHGETLSKDEMLEAVWEGSFVEENNLSQKISMLRRLFGKENDFIKTIPKKGYRFVAPVKSSHIEAIENEVKVAYVGTVNPQENSSSVSSNGISATDTENSVEDLPNTESVGHQTNSKSLVYALGGIILTFVLGFFAYLLNYSIVL